ncbi:MAG TPA: hypothetical protein VK686_11000 [Bryobacteraceae bacterium]|nr:hypothetical protein [Bryobacteraceae bacterium]
MTRLVCLFLVLTPFVVSTAMLGQKITEPSGVTISVTNAGAFNIQGGDPAWTYAGSIPGHVTNAAGPAEGFDNNQVSTNGAFDEFTVDYADPEGQPWRMQVRAYRALPSATISFSPLVAVQNKRPYAILSQFPITPHHFANAGWNRMFGLVGWLQQDSAWLFFDDQYGASILSAASKPLSERQAWIYDGTASGVIALEIDGSNPTLPAGDVYSHLITFDRGIGKTFSTWGSTLRNIDGRPITGNQSDISMYMPMLSTDAGAAYYYSFEDALGYAGTLRAAIASAKTVGIPFGLTHFDSWWYLKGGNCQDTTNSSDASWKNTSNGAWKYVVDPALFQPNNPNDLEQGFVQNLGPGMAHGRWVDPCSPYRLPVLDSSRKVRSTDIVSGNVVIDRHTWGRIARTLKQSGMVIFEPDFLATLAHAANTFDDEKFLNRMAAAMGAQGIDLQYCMPAARHILQAFKYPRVHTVRVSGDRFGWNHWDEEMYGSILLNAGSLWPTVDNFRTTEKRNLLLAVLSAGPLALSDPIGTFVPIDEAIRSDGLILKPDASLVPTDASFVAEAVGTEQYYGVSGQAASNAGNKALLIQPPLIAHTYSDFGSIKLEYVFAYSRDVNTPAAVTILPQDLGFSGDIYVYDYFGKAGWRQPAAQAIAKTVDSQGSYFVIAPVGASGMAFLGDLSKFVPASQQRVPSLADDGIITATLEFIPGETVPVSIFATFVPVISADGATVSAPVLDPGTGLYQAMVSPGQNKQASLQIAPGK